MSWSVYTAGLAADIKTRVDALEPPGQGTSEREDQVKAAKAAVDALIGSGAVGTGEGFTVSLSGHSNPEHKGNDSVSLSVAQTTSAVVEQYDAQQAAALAAEQ